MIGFDEFQDYLDECYPKYELDFNKHILVFHRLPMLLITALK